MGRRRIPHRWNTVRPKKLTDENRQKIEEIIAQMRCPRDFACVNSGFKNLCKANDIGLKSFLICREEDSHKCAFALDLGKEKLFCRCELRVYLEKNTNQ